MDPQRRLLTAVCIGGTAATLLTNALAQAAGTAGPASRKSAAANPSPGLDGHHDFDFFHGHWRLHNRRLKTWLANSDEWIEFEGRLHCQPVLDGIGNIDELTADFGEGLHGLSLRLYDPASRQWSDYWVSKRNGLLGPPVVGAFAEGVGTFFGEDEFEGRPILIRATWAQRDASEVSWEQAFSTDQGKTWETNWTMRMTRQS